MISSDVLATYAVDAAREVEGVTGIVESPLHRHRGVRVADEDGSVRIELHMAVAWGASVPELGAAVQRRVRKNGCSACSPSIRGIDEACLRRAATTIGGKRGCA